MVHGVSFLAVRQVARVVVCHRFWTQELMMDHSNGLAGTIQFDSGSTRAPACSDRRPRRSDRARDHEPNGARVFETPSVGRRRPTPHPGRVLSPSPPAWRSASLPFKRIGRELLQGFLDRTCSGWRRAKCALHIGNPWSCLAPRKGSKGIDGIGQTVARERWNMTRRFDKKISPLKISGENVPSSVAGLRPYRRFPRILCGPLSSSCLPPSWWVGG